MMPNTFTSDLIDDDQPAHEVTRVNVTHQLKTVDRYFDKTFEVRRNDRAFQTGDVLELVKVGNPAKTLRRKIVQFGIEPAYCVLGLGPDL